MDEALYRDAVAIIAGLCGGVALGAFIATRTEMRARGISISVRGMDRVGLMPGLVVVAKVTFAIILMAALQVCIILGIMRLGGVDYLASDLRVPFTVAFLGGAGGAKLVRYLYWKS